MPKFRKKPIVIDAVRLTLESIKDVRVFMGESFYEYVFSYFGKAVGIQIFTLEGNMTAVWGDWIIREVMGEHYPCKPDIFEATYEAVDEEESNA